MTRRNFLAQLGVGTAAALAPALAAPVKRRPNFVFILVDDLGWPDLGCYGSTFYETPNLDRFAASGMRFTDAYAACPVCSPTRAAIMTGKHPVRVDITDWIPGSSPKNRKLLSVQDRNELDLSEVTLAEALGEAGYRTFFAGKWHLGGEGFFPEDQGFDINKGGHHRGSPPGGYYTPYKNPKLDDGPKGEYLTDRLTDESMRFLSEQGDEPFLLYLAFYTIHTPIQACQRHLAKFKAKRAALPGGPDTPTRAEHNGWTRMRQDNAELATMVYAMDENVGRLLDKLDELKLADDTVVIFTSDNGGLSTLGRRQGGPNCSLPLRGGKGWCYEGGIRVPLIIRAPGVTRPGTTCTVPVVSMDFYPTMLELAGLPLRQQQHVDGVSLVPLLKGADTLDRETLYWHYPHYHGSTWAPGAAIRMGDWKLIEFFEEDKVELYNLKADLSETTDLAEKLPEKARELTKELHAWQRSLKAKQPLPNPAYKG